MKFSKTTTAAFLAGATTLAVSLPVMAEERTYKLAGFDQVKVSAGLTVEVEIGPEFSVIAEANSRRSLNRLEIQVRGDRLEVSRDSGWRLFSLFSAPREATVRISLPVMTAVEATSGSDVAVSGAYGDALSAEVSSGAALDLAGVSGQDLRFRASSGADLRAEGVCGALVAGASSGASIRVDDLICASVEARAASGSDIRAHASENVVASASSGGEVRISGGPQTVDAKESSGGSVRVN